MRCDFLPQAFTVSELREERTVWPHEEQVGGKPGAKRGEGDYQLEQEKMK